MIELMFLKVLILIRDFMYNASKNKWICKVFDETKYMSLSIKDDELLKKHNEIWDKIIKSIQIGFSSKQWIKRISKN